MRGDAHQAARASGPEAGTPHSKTPALSAGARNPRAAPVPYLGQQPEGEEERGVHGPAAGSGPSVRRRERRLLLGQDPAE